MPRRFPHSIVHGPGMRMPVRQKSLGGPLGHLDTAAGEIAIERDQPHAGKHLILLHEMIHLVAEHLKDQGLVKRQPDEKFVTHLAGGLFPMLALSGLWKGVSRREMEEFLEFAQTPTAKGRLRSPRR